MLYDSKNRLHRFRDTAQGGNAWQSVAYDNRGNVTDNGTASLGGLRFTYDAAEQPISISDAATGAFTYDGNLKRVKQVIDGETIYSVYSQAGVLLHRDNVTENKFTDYIRVAGQSIARVHAGGSIRYAHNDHLGSAVSETNTSSQVRWQQNFTPFGEKRDQTGGLIADAEDEEGFTGHISDATGLTYMQARYYDPVLGRFLSNDPVGFETGTPQQFNRYAYVHNDPINWLDPTGLKADPKENRKRHQEALKKFKKQLEKRGYKVYEDVRVKVELDNGDTEIRVIDLVTVPKGGDWEDADFYEIKTQIVDFGKVRPREIPGAIGDIIQNEFRRRFVREQKEKDRAIARRGATVQRNGKEVGPRSVRWKVYWYDKDKPKKKPKEFPAYPVR